MIRGWGLISCVLAGGHRTVQQYKYYTNSILFLKRQCQQILRVATLFSCIKTEANNYLRSGFPVLFRLAEIVSDWATKTCCPLNANKSTSPP